MSEDYSDAITPVRGVHVYPGESVHIVDQQGEVCMWNADEVAEDGEAFTAAINAAVLAAVAGPEAVRMNIETKGEVLGALIDNTLSPTALGLLEGLLAITEPMKNKMDAVTLQRWRTISAECADLRDGTDV